VDGDRRHRIFEGIRDVLWKSIDRRKVSRKIRAVGLDAAADKLGLK
jgi:hypothetical protein